ncbi:uncharacterized protein LOC141651130 [Silene latifolia]|uniref:uncharacterized protein LOC141651130 n=1 Tax=Silene latifolia TaxID=37657 RepID=UPI003D7767E2
MAKKSAISNNNKHLTSTKQSVTSSVIRSEKDKVLKGPDVEITNKEKSIHEISGIPEYQLDDDGLVEDVEDESDSEPAPVDQTKEDEIWYQRHGKRVMQVVEEEPQELLELSDDDTTTNPVCICSSDVQGELDYWQQAVFGFIVGANPPWQIVEGFLKRIWSKYTVDKISFLPNGVFLARFQTEEMKQTVLNSGHYLFDNKPLILKPWSPDANLEKSEIKTVPAWIRLQSLPLKFWGNSLKKIAGLIGSYIKSDSATELKTRLGFARVMVELKLGQVFPKKVKFLDEKKNLIEIDIEYEWKPCICTKCKQIGHEYNSCRKGKPKVIKKGTTQVWRPVKKVTIPDKEVTISDAVPVPQVMQEETRVQLDEGLKPAVGLITPATMKPGAQQGTISPVRPVRTKQGSEDVSKNGSHSPTYMEVLSPTNSPRQGIGISETKIKSNNLNKAINSVFHEWSISTNTSYHKGGRIWVLWKAHLYDIHFIEYNAQYIHMSILNKQAQSQFFHTIVYAFNGITERESLWLNLIRLASTIQGPWSVGGDFNCVLHANERLRGSVSMAESVPFQDCLDRCQLVDIKASGAFFTWNNKQPPETRKYSRLDRFFVNQDWMSQLPDYFANFLPEGLFDHTPCLVSKTVNGDKKNRPFKYFNMWSKAPDFLNCVAAVWNQDVAGTKMYKVVRKLKLLKSDLKQLNKDSFSDIEHQADVAETKLINIQQHIVRSPGDLNLIQQEVEAHKEYQGLYLARMEFLKQKAKAHWLKEGDSNSSYFHSLIKARRNKNFIHHIADHKGVVHKEESGIQHAFLDYYQMLLGTKSNTKKVKVGIVRKGKTCTSQHSHILMSPCTPEEVKDIFFQIPNDKAPGPDGYSSKFFKDSWDIIGLDVVEAVMDFFQSGCLLKQLNATLVTLIPKVDRPANVLQYRPIACCNVIYKCISKILCSRLAKVLPDLISPNQGGFIKERSIMENILICQDLVRLYERKAVSPRCLFKMDLQKAYDTIEWAFLDEMLQALKFPDQFREWIMQCVTTATYSINLNGNVFGFFKGRRGLRQGDPLSPLLFTICMEYLSRLLAYTTEGSSFKYHPLCKPLKLTHLMFADDLLLFCKGDAQSIMTILRTFSTFSKSSGLNMSKGKSNAYFNGVPEELKNDILKVSGLVQGTLPFKYLGVPIKTTRLNAQDCAPLIDKLLSKIRGVGARKLSYAGRLVLVQSVFKTLHNYWASMFILPTGVITKVEAICRHFLWDGGVDFLRTPLVSWDKICHPKKEGGLGLKNDILWNKAAVGKLVWWIASKSDHLWVKWVSHTYLKGQNWQTYSPPSNSSWSWRKICQTKNLYTAAYIQQIWTNQKGQEYTIAKGYEFIRVKKPEVSWVSQVWNRWSIPKHSFLVWIHQHNGLNTKDKLHKIGVSPDFDCCICDRGREDNEHLFFQCQYSRRVISEVEKWMGIRLPYQDLQEWRNSRRGSKLKRGLLNSVLNACIYRDMAPTKS